MLPVLKILTPKVIKAIMKYVFEKNELDMQMESVRARLDNLEKDSHPKKDYVLCNQCKSTIQNYEGTD
tara:strand:- start:4376 stop:4579 length:204 start_codon:yes stop_codon:yes gene_type:complete